MMFEKKNTIKVHVNLITSVCFNNCISRSEIMFIDIRSL